MEKDPAGTYELLKQELLNHHPDMTKRKHIIVQTKIDINAGNEDWEKIDKDYLKISSFSGAGIRDLIKQIGKFLDGN